ncbi:MAG: type IV secretion system DNA-binding domain-containing protein, partial [Thermoplasmata archaeon]
MNGSDAAAVGFDRPPAPEEAAELLTELAGRLAAHPDAGPVLLEFRYAPAPVLFRMLGVMPGLWEPIALRPDGPRFVPVPAQPAWEPPAADRPEGRFLVVGAAPGAGGPTVAPPGRSAPPGAPSPGSGPAPGPTPSAGPAPLLEVPPGQFLAGQVHWAPTGTGRIFTALRFWAAGPGLGPWPGPIGPVAARIRALGAAPLWAVAGPSGGRAREWRSGRWRWLRPRERFAADPAHAARLALVGGLPLPADPSVDRRHTLLFGASGSGKTSYLIRCAREAIGERRSVVVFDLHGDLTERIVAGLPAGQLARVVAIDPTRAGPVPGVALVGRDPAHRDVERAHLLAALRRLGADEHGPYWGFRLDRIFDVFLRLTQEEGGSLDHLFGLLTDPAAREMARWRTRSPELARFLEELPGLLKRNPEFLWPAAARIGRIASAPALLALVAPRGEELPVADLLGSGHALLWRLPMGELGPESAGLLTTLLATRLYLGEVARGPCLEERAGRVLFLFDEAQALAPRLLAEILTEGRKFGIAVVAATQYPDRLEAEARGAAAGSVGTHLFFRAPPAQASQLGPWLGWSPGEAARRLPALPVGVAWRIVGGPGAAGVLLSVPAPPPPEPGRWAELVDRDRLRFGSPTAEPAPALPEAEEQLLLALLAAECAGRAVRAGEIDRAIVGGSPDGSDARTLLIRLRARGDLEGPEEAPRLTEVGRLRLGFSAV